LIITFHPSYLIRNGSIHDQEFMDDIRMAVGYVKD
jgi:uracil-DNA glycosylase